MTMGHWWYDTDRRELKYFEINLSQCLFVNHQFHMDWLGNEPGPAWRGRKDTKKDGWSNWVYDSPWTDR
jgi:hypothetical protein